MSTTSGQPTWIARHWPWLAAGGCLLLLATVGLFVGGIFLVVSASMKSSEPYQVALEAARRHPEVVEALGEPIEPGLLPTGSIETSGPGGSADLAIPISGPKGAATVYVSARKTAGRWQLDVLEAAIDGREGRVQLIDPR
jgi:hypothetical protein